LKKTIAIGECPSAIMISQKIVAPSQIESELLKIWESLNRENTNRAGLFTLIVYCKKNERLNYIRDIVQNLIEKFPSRIIFITYEPNAKESYLKTAVSVLFQSDQQKEIACDSIDIGVGKNDIEKVQYVILPLLLTDLPVYLLWCENPLNETKLFFHLKELASKIIFNSESANNIFDFAKFTIQHFSDQEKDLVDLNWLKMENLKEIITTEFSDNEKVKILSDIEEIHLTINKKKNPCIKQYTIQAYYFIFWLAAKLNWKPKSMSTNEKKHSFTFQSDNLLIQVTLDTATFEQFTTGDILNISMKSKTKSELFLERSTEFDGFKVDFLSLKQCDLPHNFRFSKFELGHYLANEMVSKNPNSDYIKTLSILSKIKND
jgi:Glucose-6-phosphate dehydrogenase subunit N-terminal domain/Glucose-6-phosphate dehydrogenase subunit C-terminal domain